ncbi:MAG: hypothetical protein MIO92_10575 [Methanosarcinaceae archaeon]|nr:hypothetical protein [Methanosarcinaceae archaeon]
MEKQDEDVKALMELRHGQHYIVPQSDYGRAEIWLINNAFFVFEIPLFGGEPQFSNHFWYNYAGKDLIEKKQKSAQAAMDLINSWT